MSRPFRRNDSTTLLAMDLKAIIQKIASWFKSDVAVVEQDAKAVEATVLSDLYTLQTQIAKDGRVFVAGIASPISTIEAAMGTPATDTQVAAPTAGNNVNTAVQIALALKAIDASLSVEAVQAATTAALDAAYPAA